MELNIWIITNAGMLMRHGATASITIYGTRTAIIGAAFGQGENTAFLEVGMILKKKRKSGKVMSNNHPSRNKAAAVLKQHHEQYEALETIARLMDYQELDGLAHAIRSAISDLKHLRNAIDSINKSKQS